MEEEGFRVLEARDRRTRGERGIQKTHRTGGVGLLGTRLAEYHFAGRTEPIVTRKAECMLDH